MWANALRARERRRPSVSALPVRSLNNYATVVRAGFGQRRKMLRNSLAAQLDPSAMAALDICGIDLRRRAETLSLSEFARLADALPDDPASETR